MDASKFRQLFRFIPENTLKIGIERESFLVDASGSIVPFAWKALEALNDPRFCYELSACQIEERIGPCDVGVVKELLANSRDTIAKALKPLGLQQRFLEVAPEDMPLDVFPDPSGRYQQIAGSMSKEKLSAACRVTGTHVHVGMPSHEIALTVYNRVVPKLPELCEMGNGSFGERLALYRVVAPQCQPQAYSSWDCFYEEAVRNGYDTNPRRCWSLIRISPHGTIEFRMFGAVDCDEKVCRWARYCHSLCSEAVRQFK